MNNPLDDLLKRLIALAETGIYYARNEFDLQRYNEILDLSVKALSTLFDAHPDEIAKLVIEKNGYKTPKVDVRAVIFDEQDRILLVKEKIDGKWALPGGWAEIGFSPSEVAVKESLEEAGARVTPVRLLAVMDKKMHAHPSDIYYIYKIFIECSLLGWEKPDELETTEAAFYPVDRLPELSLPRITPEQIQALHHQKQHTNLQPLFD